MLQSTYLVKRGNSILNNIINKRNYVNKSKFEGLSKKLQSSKINKKNKKKLESQLLLMKKQNELEVNILFP